MDPLKILRHICLYISDLVFLARVNRSWIVHEDSSGKTESFTWMHWPWHLLYLTNRAQSMESRELRRILWQSCPPEGPQFQVIILFTNVRRQRLLIHEKRSMIFCKHCVIILSLLLIRHLTCCPRIKWFARLSVFVGPSPNMYISPQNKYCLTDVFGAMCPYPMVVITVME